eukprot:scaffold165409_cov15-Tisochrysis_lutea.AAC.1
MERNRAKADELAKEEAALKAEQEEQDALQRIINSFKSYRRFVTCMTVSDFLVCMVTADHCWQPSQSWLAAFTLQPVQVARIYSLAYYLSAYRSAELDVCRWQQNFAKLPKHHQEWLASQHHKYARALQCIYSNNFFILSMVGQFCRSKSKAPSLALMYQLTLLFICWTTSAAFKQ